MEEEQTGTISKRSPIRWSKRSSNWQRHLQEFQQFQELRNTRRSFTVDSDEVSQDDDDILTESSDDSSETVILADEDISIDNYEDITERRRSGSRAEPIRPKNELSFSSIDKVLKKVRARKSSFSAAEKKQQSLTKFIKSAIKKVPVIDPKMFPEFLGESKLYSHASCQFLGNKTLMSFYSNTGAMLFLNYQNAWDVKEAASMSSSFLTADHRQHFKPYRLENSSPLLACKIHYPWIASIHENGIIQVYHMITESSKKAVVPETKSASAQTAIFINQDNLYIVTPTRILEYDPYEISTLQREFPYEGSTDLKHHLSHFVGDSIFFLCGAFEFQFRDISEDEPRLLGRSSKESLQLTSILATYSAWYTVVIVTREKYFIWKARAGEAKQVMEVAMTTGVIVTTVLIDENFIFVGHSNGLVTVRRTDNGEYLYDLNTLSESSLSSQDTSHSKLTGLNLDDKVNCIEKVSKWVICGFHNARICIYELAIPKGHPIAECKTSKSGSVKTMIVESGCVNFVVQKNKEDKKMLVLGTWFPSLSDSKSFFQLSEFDAKLKVGRPFEWTTMISPVKQLIAKEGYFISLHQDNKIASWSIEEGKVTLTIEVPEGGKITSIAVFRRTLIIIQKNTVRTYDLKEQKWLNEYTTNSEFSVFAHGSRLFYVGTNEGTCYSYELLQSGGTPKSSFLCHPCRINAIQLRDGILYTASDDHSIKSFHVMTSFHGKEGDIKNIYAGHTAGVTDIKIIKTTITNVLYSVSKDNTLRTWDTNYATCLKMIQLDPSFKLNFNSLHEISRSLFLIRNRDPSSFEFVYTDLKRGSVKKSYMHKSPVKLISMLNDRDVVTVTNDNAVYRWDLETNEISSIYHTYQNNITSLATFNERIYLGDEEGQIIEIDTNTRLLPEVPTMLVVNSEKSEISISEARQFKQKGSHKNMRKEFKGFKPIERSILETSDECRAVTPELEVMLSNFDNSDLWNSEMHAHLTQKRKSPTPMIARTRAGSADRIIEPTYFEEERRKDPSILVWRNPLYGRDVNTRNSRKVRANSTSALDTRGIGERSKVWKRLGMKEQKKKATTTEILEKKELFRDPDVNFF